MPCNNSKGTDTTTMWKLQEVQGAMWTELVQYCTCTKKLLKVFFCLQLMVSSDISNFRWYSGSQICERSWSLNQVLYKIYQIKNLKIIIMKYRLGLRGEIRFNVTDLKVNEDSTPNFSTGINAYQGNCYCMGIYAHSTYWRGVYQIKFQFMLITQLQYSPYWAVPCNF